MFEDDRTEDQKQFGHYAFPILFGFFAVIVLWLAHSSAPTHDYYNPSHPNKAEETYSDSPSVSKLPEYVDAKTETTKEYTEKEKEAFVRERSDLAAQWAMAHYTYIGIWIGLIGVAFIIWTLIESRKAAYFAERTLQHTQNATRRELRAYIAQAGRAIEVFEVGKKIKVAVAFQNYGSTPAYSFCFIDRVGIDRVQSAGYGRRHQHDLMAPSASKTFRIESDDPLTDEVKRAIESGESMFLVDMLCLFTDTFGQNWHYRARMYADNNTANTNSRGNFNISGGALYFYAEEELSEENHDNYPEQWGIDEILE